MTCVASASSLVAMGDGLLETETARLLRYRTYEVGFALERQISRDGREFAVPFSLGIGLPHDLELLIEPVPYSEVRSRRGLSGSGIGDTEITLSRMLRRERRGAPAFAAAFEVKLPTAKDRAIGTRVTDYAAYLVASRACGRLDTHSNLSYTVVGVPAGTEVRNVWAFALAAEYTLSERIDLAGEVLGSTSSNVGGGENSNTPELTSGELSGLVGFRYYLGGSGVDRASKGRSNLFAGLSLDNRNAALLRVGFSRSF